jgi:hypothetical protein
MCSSESAYVVETLFIHSESRHTHLLGDPAVDEQLYDCSDRELWIFC